MKYILYLLLIPLVLMGCTHETDELLLSETEIPVYRMRFDVSCKDYEGEEVTRVNNGIWEDGEQVYFRFHEVGGDVIGIATYDAATETWNVKPNKVLVATDISECEALYFINPTNTTNYRITLTTESVIYTDTTATYLVYDDLLIVTAVLSPKTGRIRFKGAEEQMFSVEGLSYYAEYNCTENKFSTKSIQFASNVSADGYSSFAYTYFTNENNKTLLFDYTDNAGFFRTFPEKTLRSGESGYITIPTIEKYDGWTLVNKRTMNEIVLPEVDPIKVKSIRSTSAVLGTTIISVGNGTVSDVGFIYSTQANLTLENGIKISSRDLIGMEYRLKGLVPETTYYTRAYVTNEKGTFISGVVQFKTISIEEDRDPIIMDIFGDDDNLNDEIITSGTINKKEFEFDEKFNENISSSSNIDKGEYGKNDNLNDNIQENGSISKEGYPSDENLN